MKPFAKLKTCAIYIYASAGRNDKKKVGKLEVALS